MKPLHHPAIVSSLYYTFSGFSQETGQSSSYGMFGGDFNNNFGAGLTFGAAPQSQPNYQPAYSFPVQFNDEKVRISHILYV